MRSAAMLAAAFLAGLDAAPAFGQQIAYVDPALAQQHASAKPAEEAPKPIPTKRPGDSCTWEEIAAKYYVNPRVLYAIAVTESNLNPMAINKGNGNGTEDVGMMQINSSWYPRLKRDFGISRDDLFDPCVSLDVGAWVLADNMRRMGNNWDAIGAYNAISPHKRQRYAQKVFDNLP